MKNHSYKIKLISLSVALVFLSKPTVAGIGQEMQQMYNDIGGMGNVTNPGAFNGQAMNMYTGGSMMMRAPGRNYNFWSLDMPSIRAGCGGIDLYGGSFSFINKDAFNSMMKNVASNAVGYFFKLALSAISKEMHANIESLMKSLEGLTNFNRNSCQMAQSLVNGVVGAVNSSVQSGCSNVAQSENVASDRADSDTMCNTNSSGILSGFSGSQNPNVKNAVYIKGNVAWDATAYLGWSNELRELMMSISGTYIVDATQENTKFIPLSPKIQSVKDLVLGNSESATASPDKITLTVYRCTDAGDGCLNVTEVQQDVVSFQKRVVDSLQSLSTKIQQGNQPVSQSEREFVSNVSIPIYKMLSVGNAYGSSLSTGIGGTLVGGLIENYKDLIAFDYAETLLTRELRYMQNILGRMQRPIEDKNAEKLIENIRLTLGQIHAEKTALYSQKASIDTMVERMNLLEKQFRTETSPQVQAMLQLSSMMNQQR